jgi:hypothetical protein
MSNVVFVGKLKEIFIDKYIEFITDPNSQQPIEEGGAEIAGTEDDEYDEDEEIEEMLEEVSKSQENRKKWYH